MNELTLVHYTEPSSTHTHTHHQGRCIPQNPDQAGSFWVEMAYVSRNGGHRARALRPGGRPALSPLLPGAKEGEQRGEAGEAGEAVEEEEEEG